MRLPIAAACALLFPSVLVAQAAPAPSIDYGVATPSAGTWNYVSTAAAGDANFVTGSTIPQVTIHCTRATRRVVVSRPATGAAPFMTLWTTSQSRDVPASYNPLTARISIDLAGSDPLLDALAFSRARFAVGVRGTALYVVPAMPEVARVIEDCRS